MDNATTRRTSSKARIPQHDCHGKECASGARNKYYLGKHLTPDSYEIEQVYSIERRRLINRAVLGWGVVYGFAFSMKEGGDHEGELQIGEGLAFDRLGRELVQAHLTELSLDNFVILDHNKRPILADGNLNDRIHEDHCGEDKCWLLTAHYAEKTIGQIPIKDPCHCDRVEWDRTCETIIYALQPIDCSACCEKWECEIKCNCPPESACCKHHREELEKIDYEIRGIIETYDETGPDERKGIEDRLSRLVAQRNKIERERHARGGCACLCEDVTRWHPGGKCPCMIDVDDCTRADLDNGIRLACVRLDRDKCERWSIVSIVDACGPRHLVKRNDLLFDLVNGCDVTRIIETGWAKWHRRNRPEVPFGDFQKALGWKGKQDPEHTPTRDFWVRFSRPVQSNTVKADAFAMTVVIDTGDDYWLQPLRMPISAIDTDVAPAEPGDPTDCVRSARIVVDAGWLEQAVNDPDHFFGKWPFRVEIEVRGDLIVDCLGQQVDGNARGRSPYPSGNGSPGGSYFSSFAVGQRVRAKPPQSKQSAKPAKPQPAPQEQQPSYRNI